MADRSVSYEFIGNFNNLRAGLAAAGRDVQAFGTQLTALDKNGAKMRAGLTTIGSAAGKFGLVVGAGLAFAVKSAADFDQAMSNIQAATHETSANMDLLREAALQAGADTAFSATEAASAIENLAKAGVSTQDILGGGLSGALDLAAAGGIDVATAAEQAATAMTQFGLAGADVPHIADLLAAAAGKAQGEVTDMGAALNQSGLIADQVGLSIEETTGALASFASAGLLGSDAGTSFKTMLGALTPNSEKAKSLMEELGISAYDAQGNFIGLADFAGNLRDALSGMTDEQRQATLETIFGSDAVRAASILYEQGADGIQTWINKVDDQGYAAETAATKLDNLKGDLEALGGSLETAFIGTGDGSQGPLRSLVQGITSVVNAYNELPGAAKNAVGALSGVAALLGGGLWAASKVVNGIASAQEALKNLGVEAGRTKGILSGIAKGGISFGALVISLDLLQRAFEGLTDSAVDLSSLNRELDALADGRIVGSMEDLSMWLDDIGDKWQRDWNPLSRISPWDPSGYENAEEGLKGVDEALAGLVEGGNSQQAAEIFARIKEEAKDAGLSTSDLRDTFEQYDTALRNAGIRTSWLGKILGDVPGLEHKAGDGAKHMGDAMGDAAPKIDKAAQALRESQKASHEAAQGFYSMADAVEKPALSLADLEKRMARQAEVTRQMARDMQTAIENGANPRALQQMFEELGTSGARAFHELAAGGKDAASKFNASFRNSQGAASSLEDALNHLANVIRNLGNMKPTPKVHLDGAEETDHWIGSLRSGLTGVGKQRPTPKVTLLGADEAAGKVSFLKGLLASLHDKTIHITTIQNTIGGVTSTAGGHTAPGEADGGSVPKDGGPYADRFLYRLAPGEEIISNRYGQADRFRADRAAGRIPGYAEGGTVGRPSSTPSWADFSPWALAAQAAEQATRTMLDLGAGIGGLNKQLKLSTSLQLAELRDRKHHLDELLKLQEKERDALKERLDALRQERESIVQGVAGIIGASADLLAGVTSTQRRGLYDWTIDPETGVGSSVLSGFETSQTEGPATYQSFVNGLTTQFGTATELKSLLKRLKSLGISGPLLSWLIQNGADIDTLRDFANQDPSQIRGVNQLFGQVQQFTGQVGNQAAGVVGLNSAIDRMHDRLVEANHQYHEMNQRLHQIENRMESLKKSEDNTTQATREGAEKVVKVFQGVVGDGQRRRTR